MQSNYLTNIVIFDLNIKMNVFFYIFIAIAVLAFIIYILNFLFYKHKLRSEREKDTVLTKKYKIEKEKEILDKEIRSVLRNRKER